MSIAIIVPKNTPRLSYTLDWIFVEQLGVPYELYFEHPAGKDFQLIINYITTTDRGLTIPNMGLLFETNIQQQSSTSGKWDAIPTLFAANSENGAIPFDIFSAVFYCIARYEEYLPFTPDKHQRFPAAESILYKSNLLGRPIVDEWVYKFGALLETYGIKLKQKQFQWIPTYDIDIAWSYKNKGLKRTLGGYIKDVAAHNLEAVQERTAVLSGHKQDPFNSFDFLDKLHKENQLKPLYFILASAKNGTFDKHILPTNKNMKVLIQTLSEKYKLGMHPPYYSNEQPELLGAAQQILAEITGQKINISRQHFIKFTLPETYKKLIALGIEQDYSMGYATHLGFRAGTSRPFYWYNLKEEKKTCLIIFPFCFMDTTAHYELSLSADEAFEQLENIRTTLEKIGGLLVTVFHNFSLGTDKEWKGWAKSYEDFTKK